MVQDNITTELLNNKRNIEYNHMEFRIDKTKLIKGLEKTLTVVERRSTMPALNYALLELKDGTLQISATDLEIFISATCACDSITEGRLAVPARSVYDIVKACSDNEMIHLRSLEGNRIEILSGKSHFKLLGLAPDSFPHFKASPKGELSTARLNCEAFAKLISQTEYSVSTEEIRYFLTGIFLESSKEETLRAVATDGSRLAKYDLPQEPGNELGLAKGLIIPKKGCSELRKLLEGTDEEDFELSCDENLLRAQVGDFQIWIRPIDGEFPNYRPVIPESLPHKYIINRGEFINSLKKMALLVSDRSRVVTFEFAKNKIILSTNNPDLGEAKDELAVASGDASVKTGFNVRYFLEALNNFSGETIELSVGDKLQPAVIRSADDTNYLVVVMPMRI